MLTARQLHESCRSRTEAARRGLEDGAGVQSNGATKRLSRILSHAPVEGAARQKGDVYLDELAHYVNDREVYRGSTALILPQQRAAHRVQHAARSARHLLGSPTMAAQSTPPPGNTLPWWLCPSSPPT